MPDDITSQTDQAPGTPAPAPETPQTPDFGAIANAAASSHFKRFEKQLPTMLEGFLKPLQEQIAALKAVPQPGGDDDKKSKPLSPEIVAMQQQLEEFKRAASESENKRLAAEKKGRDDRAFNELKSHLSKAVRPDMIDVLAAHLFHIQKTVEVDEDGSAYFKGTSKNFGVEEEVRFPLADGVSNWLKGESAKPWLPAPGVSNTQQKNRQTINANSLPANLDLSKATDAQKLQAAEMLEQRMRSELAKRGLG